MKIKRTLALILAFTAALILASCSQSNYPHQQQKHPKDCDCPKWK